MVRERGGRAVMGLDLDLMVPRRREKVRERRRRALGATRHLQSCILGRQRRKNDSFPLKSRAEMLKISRKLN